MQRFTLRNRLFHFRTRGRRERHTVRCTAHATPNTTLLHTSLKMSERKAVIKNADMSEVRGGRVSTPRAFSVAPGDGNGRHSRCSPFCRDISARSFRAPQGRTRRSHRGARLTNIIPKSSTSLASQDLQQDAVDCATQVRLSGARRLWNLPTFGLTVRGGGARGDRARIAALAKLNAPGRHDQLRERFFRLQRGARPVHGLGPPPGFGGSNRRGARHRFFPRSSPPC